MNTHSTPLDTLKGTALRGCEWVDYIKNELAAGETEIPEDIFDHLDALKQLLIGAVGEHLPLIPDPHFPESFKALPKEAYWYEDGTPIAGFFESETVRTNFFYRYHGGVEVARKRHQEHIREHEELLSSELEQFVDEAVTEVLDTTAETLLAPEVKEDGALFGVIAFPRDREETHISLKYATVEQLEQPFHERHRFAYGQAANLLRAHGHETYLAGFEAGLFSPVEGSQR